jgi:hypothetical protein
MPRNWADHVTLNTLADAITDRTFFSSATFANSRDGPTLTNYNANRCAVGDNAGLFLRGLFNGVRSLIDPGSSGSTAWLDPSTDFTGQSAFPSPTVAQFGTWALGDTAGPRRTFVKEISSTAVSSATWGDGSTLANGDNVRSKADGRIYLRSGGRGWRRRTRCPTSFRPAASRRWRRARSSASGCSKTWCRC